MLSEEAVLVADIDVAEARNRLSDAEKALADADEGSKDKAEDERRIAEAMVAAAATA